MFAAVCKASIGMAAIWSVVPLSTARAYESEPNKQITVCLYNYARLSDQILTKSQIEVNRIFGHAGVGLEWFQNVRSDAGTVVVCGDAGGLNGLVLKLIPEQMAAHFHPLSKELGFAAGTQAWVFVDRVRTVSESHDFFIVLSDVMAHELGHLLLGPGHSPSGIMRASYGNSSFLNAEFGSLLFTREQARQLHKATFQASAKPFGNTLIRSSLPRSSPDRQSVPALPGSSQALLRSDAGQHTGR